MRRNLQRELMDDPALDPREHRRALDGLARLNRVSSAARGMWNGVRQLLGEAKSASLLDVAAGSGDVLVDVSGHAARNGVRLSLEACDISGEAVGATTRRAAAAGVRVVGHRLDVLRERLPHSDGGVDIVTCSLFLHHLREEHAEAVLREMARVARLGVVAIDLQRCVRGLVAAKVASRVLTRSPVVHVDAVRSVHGAFTRDELRTMADRAGLAGATLTSVWPWRMRLVWRRP